MDTFAHALWSFILFHKTEHILLSVFFGVAPDLFSWTIFMFYRLSKGSFGKPPTKIPSWMHVLYGVTHSIFVFSATIGVVFLAIGSVPVYLWAWLVHILIDVPTHSRDFLPTPFLWPLSDWTFPGFSWGQRWFMILNWVAIVTALVIILL